MSVLGLAQGCRGSGFSLGHVLQGRQTEAPARLCFSLSGHRSSMLQYGLWMALAPLLAILTAGKSRSATTGCMLCAGTEARYEQSLLDLSSALSIYITKGHFSDGSWSRVCHQ